MFSLSSPCSPPLRAHRHAEEELLHPDVVGLFLSLWCLRALLFICGVTHRAGSHLPAWPGQLFVVLVFLVSLWQLWLTLDEPLCVATGDAGFCLVKVTAWICSRYPLQNVMSTAAGGGGNRKKRPSEFTLTHGAVEPSVIISQQCFGPLSGLTAPGLQAALLNADDDLL